MEILSNEQKAILDKAQLECLISNSEAYAVRNGFEQVRNIQIHVNGILLINADLTKLEGNPFFLGV